MLRNFFYSSVPFIASFITFLFLSKLNTPESFPAPNLIGLSTADAIIVLSQQNLHPHILEQREDASTNPGTIIEQSPRQGQQIKEKQSIFLVVSRAILPPKAPDFSKLTQTQIKELAHSKQMLIRNIPLHHITPRGTIIAQYPAPEETIPAEGVILYSSKGSPDTPLITPDLRNYPIEKAEQILQEKNITAQIIQSKKQKDGMVIAQKPLPGTIFTSAEPPVFQLETN